jgi:peptidoglycan/xylan/chitin deacetylase (PgdA/CDA1 family)
VSARTIILAYHNVVPDEFAGYGDSSLHITLSRFREHLDAVASIADVVHLKESLRASRRRGRPRIVLTFDDAYRGTLTIGFPELEARGWPSVMFVPPAFVPDRTFWWDDVARSPKGMSALLRERALTEWAGRDAEVRATLVDGAVASAPAVSRCATEAELGAVTRNGLVAFGSHTWSHPNLTRVTPEELHVELTSSHTWLRERFPSALLPWISYPYGLENAEVREATRRAGYAGALRVSGGWLPETGGDQFALPRLNVPAGLSAEGLVLRLSGLFS